MRRPLVAFFVLAFGFSWASYAVTAAWPAAPLLFPFGPFLAALPVGGRDGTLSARMKDAALAGRVQAKTGTIANVRALSGFLESGAGERFVFSMIANHFTAPSAEIDAVVERALARIAR